MHESQSADPHLATALEESFVGNRQTAPIQRGRRKQGPSSLSPAMPAWKLNADTLKSFFNREEGVTRKPGFRRPVYLSQTADNTD